MVNYICPKCNKDFHKKSHYVEHTENKKKPCDKSDFLVPPKSTNTLFYSDFVDNLKKDQEYKSNKCICVYCEKTFARIDSLQRHLNGRCKSKKNLDELQELKEDVKLIIVNNQSLEKVIIDLKKKIENISNGTEDELLINNEYELKPKTKREPIPQIVRFAVWENSFGKVVEGKCVCCKKTTISITNFDCGHIISNRDGGKANTENLRPICKTCNSSMGTKNMNEFIEKYGL